MLVIAGACGGSSDGGGKGGAGGRAGRDGGAKDATGRGGAGAGGAVDASAGAGAPDAAGAGGAAGSMDAAAGGSGGSATDGAVVGDGGASDAPTLLGAPCVGGAAVCAARWGVEARHLVYDSTRGRLYVSVQGGAARYPNTITTVDPRANTVTSSIPIGSDPDPLALSDEASTLWIGMDGAFSMRKLALAGATPVVGPMHPLAAPTMYAAGAIAQALLPLADGPDAVVALGANASPGNLSIFDDGTKRTAPLTGSGLDPFAIISGPPGWFFGNSSLGFEVFAVSASGIARTSFQGLPSGAMFYAAGRVYTESAVIDVSNPAAPVRVGTLPFTGFVAPHSANRLVMLSAPAPGDLNGQWQLRLIDTQSLTQKGSIAIPTALLSNALDEQISDLTYAGGDAVALISGTLSPDTRPELVVLHAPLLANDGAGPSGAGGISGAGGSGGAPAPTCAGCSLKKLDVPAYRMTYDAARSRLYAVATYDAPHDPDSLFSIDATAGTVLATVSIDPNPRQLALSDDGATLWVGFDEATSFRKFSVASTPPVAGAMFSIPKAPSSIGPMTATAIDFEPLPGAATSIAAALTGVATTRVAIFDDGVPRPTIDASPLRVSRLAVGPAGTLFGYDSESSAFTFATYTVSADGVTLLASQQGLLGGFQNDIHYNSGRIYGNSGEVVDVSTPAKPVRVGKFAFDGVITARSANRMLMLTVDPSSAGLLLRILETDNFTQVAALPVTGQFGGPLSFGSLVYLGNDGVAFLDSDGANRDWLYIFRAPAIATPP
jgi:hypothetical protein